MTCAVLKVLFRPAGLPVPGELRPGKKECHPMHRFYITPENISGNTAVIHNPEAGHLRRVLRLTIGDTVELADGRGAVWESAITGMDAQAVTLCLGSRTDAAGESPVAITVAQGMLKDKKMDMLIRHLTELGITRWIPFFAHRSVPRPRGAKLAARVERWHRIAREAMKQCKRSRLPQILEPMSFTELLACSGRYDTCIAFWEEARIPFGTMQAPPSGPPRNIILLIGPEGGFPKREIQAAEAAGFSAFSLGSRILRAETATLTATALVQHRFGDLGQKIP